MIRKAIDESLGRIELDQSGQERIWNKIQEREQSGAKRFVQTAGFYRRPIRILTAVFLLILALSALCVAAELPSKIMDLLEPVDKAVVYDGIEMKTVSAVADDDSIMILYTLRDLEGNRITEHTSVYDFTLSRTATLGNMHVGYDAKTRTATFCMLGDNGSEMKGQKLTLSVTSFLDGAPMELHETKRSIQELLQNQREGFGEPGFRDYNADAEDSFWIGQSQKGADLREKFEEKDSVPILQEGSMDMAIPGVDWVTVTNIGYLDGWLHVRLKYDGEKSQINHGYLCLTDSKGNELDRAVLNTSLPENIEEYILEAGSNEDLSKIYLSGVYTNYASLNTGEWETTFKVKGVETKSVACSAETDSAKIKRIVLSPLGVTASGTGEPAEKIRLLMKDGRPISSEGFSCSADEETGKFECKYKFTALVDIQAVDSIDFSGEIVPVP